MSKCKSRDLSLIKAWKIVAFTAFLSLLIIFSPQPVQAESPEHTFENPSQLKSYTKPGHVDFNLDVQYVKGTIYNPTTKTYDNVRLRSYVDKSKLNNKADNNIEFVGPTIQVEPGNTVRINLANKLPNTFDPDKCKDKQGKPEENQLNCNNYNITNLHSHGLWISPAGNSDNVLSVVKPGVTFQYEYNIPSDHPAGTFWYHPHLHGSSSLQVASGMSGALIVRGDRLPSESANGDIDTLLKGAGVGKQQEETLVFQQIQYACRKKYQTGEDEKPEDKWNCQPEEEGEIESYNGVFGSRESQSWANSGRYTSINGKVMPIFTANTGEIKRWRMIHAGVRNTINLEFRKAQEGAPDFYEYLETQGNTADSYRQTYCPNTNERLPYHIIADDGLTRSAAYETKLTTLQPGYRNDALVVFPAAGRYCVVDAKGTAAASVSQQEEKSQILALVNVTGSEIPQVQVSDLQDNDVPQYLINKLVAAANKVSIPLNTANEKIEQNRNNILTFLTSKFGNSSVEEIESNENNIDIFLRTRFNFEPNSDFSDFTVTDKETQLKIKELIPTDTVTNIKENQDKIVTNLKNELTIERVSSSVASMIAGQFRELFNSEAEFFWSVMVKMKASIFNGLKNGSAIDNIIEENYNTLPDYIVSKCKKTVSCNRSHITSFYKYLTNKVVALAVSNNNLFIPSNTFTKINDNIFNDLKNGLKIHQYLKNKLVAAATQLPIPANVQNKIITDLQNGLKLTAFTPHSKIQDSEVKGHKVRELSFYIDTNKTPLLFEVSNDLGDNPLGDNPLGDNPKFEPYSHNRVDRILTLGEAEEWHLESNFAGHPFHIHVNPFQIVAIYDPDGKDVSKPDVIDDFNGAIDPEYRGLKGVWKDTIWVKPPSGNKRYRVVIRTRYERYIGDFVLHCHILDHEDEGMMQNVSIVIPGTVSVETETDGNN